MLDLIYRAVHEEGKPSIFCRAPSGTSRPPMRFSVAGETLELPDQLTARKRRGPLPGCGAVGESQRATSASTAGGQVSAVSVASCKAAS